VSDFLHFTYNPNDPDIASSFDQVSFWSARFGSLLFRELPLGPNLNILDLACGTGFPLVELAQVYGTSCQVTGIDIWKEALERARLKVKAYQLTNVQVMQADAAHLTFDDKTFDLIISHLGLNNFTEPEAVLAECFRVARPRAHLVLTTNPVGNMSEFYEVFRATLQELQKPDYLERLRVNESHRGTKESISAMLQAAGFRVVKTKEDSFQFRYLDGGALFNHILTKVGFLDGWRQVINPEDEQHVFAILENKLNQIASIQGELRMTVPMLYLEAEKPDGEH